MLSVAGDRTSSITMTITGQDSNLSASIHPEIELDSRYNYSCALLDFYSYNSIPNVHEGNNRFYFYKPEKVYPEFGKEETVDVLHGIYIPVGSYELKNLISFLDAEFKKQKVDINILLNENTLRCVIKTDVTIDFTLPDCIGPLFGFGSYVLAKERMVFKSDNIINIHHVSNIRINCDLITGSYHNGESSRTIHEFSPKAAVGSKIRERPTNLIYLPIVKRRINTLNFAVVDQDGNFVNFRGEKITCRIHIKRVT